MSTEKKMLRKTSRLKTEQATGGWIKLLRKQLHRLHCSPNNDQIMEDEMDGTSGIHGGINTDFWWQTLQEREHVEELGVYKINKLGIYGLDSSGSGQGPEARSCENGKGISDSNECRKLLYLLRNY